MQSRSLHILVIEAKEEGFNLISDVLSKSNLSYTLTWKEQFASGISYLKKIQVDAILLDLDLPGYSGLDSLDRIVSLNHDSAVIVLTGKTNEQLGLEAVKLGAHDYIVKDDLHLGFFPRLLRYAIERKDSEQILKNHQANLEKEVNKRTHELVRANLMLKDEIETRKKIEYNLIESEENFRLITTSAQDAIVKMDCYGKIAFWNPGAEKIFGYTSKEIIGKDAHQLITLPQLREQASKALQHFLVTGKGKYIGRTIELLGQKKDGSIIPIEISLSTLHITNSKPSAVGIIRDITERKRAETIIRENNFFLQTLIDTIPVPIYYKNIDGSYLGSNKAFLEFAGKNPEDVIGKTDHQVIPEEYARKFSEMDVQLLNTGEQQVFESLACNSHKQKRNVIFHKAAYKNTEGEIAGLVGVFFDITEPKKITSELQQLKESLESKVEKRTNELREANATKDKFFSIIAHDLKSPFNIIQGFLSLIHEEFREFTKDELKEFIRKTLEVSSNTYALLEDLLEWSRSQRGLLDYKPVNVHLSSQCDEVLFLLNENAAKKDIQIINKIEKETQVFADSKMVSTILRNLISNAIKFSFPNNKILIFTSSNGNIIDISVQDFGTGIPELELEKLFKICEKVQTAGTQKERGTGLGLIICKDFVDINKGKICAHSEYGHGSTFTFSLPAKQA